MRKKEMFFAAGAALLPTLVWILLRGAAVYFRLPIAVALAADALFLLPLKVGRAGCFFYKAAGYRFSFRNLFLPFSAPIRYFNAVGLALLRKAAVYAVGGVFFIPAALMFGAGTLPLALCGFATGLVGVLALLYLHLRLFLSDYFFALGDSAARSLFRSIVYTRRGAGKVLFLELSFVPGAIVCAAVLPAFFLFWRYLYSRARLAKNLIVNF